MSLHGVHNGIIAAEDLASQGMGSVHPLQGLVIAYRFHVNMVEAAIPFTCHHLPNEDLRGIGPGHLLRCTLYICPPAPADRVVVAVAHNPPNQPLHLTGCKGMPGRQGHAVPPGVIVVRKGIIVFLRHTRLNAVGHLTLPGIQAPKLCVVVGCHMIPKPQV